MLEQPTYPQFVYAPRTRTHLRYNSPVWVFPAGESQLQVQYLRERHLLRSAVSALMAAAQGKSAQAG